MGKSYDQNCPVARTIEIIGERWTVLILRDLLLRGPNRFQDFLASLRGIGPTTLSARLKSLEAAGIVERWRRAVRRWLRVAGWLDRHGRRPAAEDAGQSEAVVGPP